MNTRIATYRIGELARLSGVSVRMLRHYDDIGLLPAMTGENGYRYYDGAALKRLQEILFYRAFDMGLEEIRTMLAGGDRLGRLQRHRDRLRGKHQDMANMLAALDRTIAMEKRGQDMSIEDLYKPFPAEKQAEYEAWLVRTYGADMAEAVQRAKQAEREDPTDFRPEKIAELKDIEAKLVQAMKEGLNGTDLDTLLDRHRGWVGDMWKSPREKDVYVGLADMYLAHPDFVARYEALAPKFSQWLPKVMKEYAARV